MPQATSKYGSPCPVCGNPHTTPDVLRKMSGRMAFPIVLTGCDVCHILYREQDPVADSER